MRQIWMHRLPLPAICAFFLLVGIVAGGVTMLIMKPRGKASHNVNVVTVQGVPVTASAFYRKLETRTGRNAIAKLSTDAMALKFAESIGAVPNETEVEKKARQQGFIKGWNEFAAKHLLTDEDVRQIYRLQLARNQAVRICNANPGVNSGGNQRGAGSPSSSNTARAVGARYVERFAEFRRNAKTEVFAKQYLLEITGHNAESASDPSEQQKAENSDLQ